MSESAMHVEHPLIYLRVLSGHLNWGARLGSIHCIIRLETRKVFFYFYFNDAIS
jgi:hypothetical protein